jgi:hypothetical protein
VRLRNPALEEQNQPQESSPDSLIRIWLNANSDIITVIAEVTPVGFSTIGYKYYIIYAAINAFSVIVFYFFYPETKGRTLEEIDEIFVQSKTIFDPVRIARELPFREVLEKQTDEKAAEAERVRDSWKESV